MTNVFNIEFQYKGATYAAWVSVRYTNEEYSVNAHILNDKLQNIVPEGELHFRFSNNLRKASEPVQGGKMELIRAIRETIMEELPKLKQPS